MMAILRARWNAALICVIAPALMLTGCGTEYHGFDSGIDGVLWRQVAAFDDPLSQNLYEPGANQPRSYIDALDGARWDGVAASARNLGIKDGGVVLYDISSSNAEVRLSVFISSGPRTDSQTDDGHDYTGPSAVFTCFGIKARFHTGAKPRVARIVFTECPEALVKTAPKDAAFASEEVFDG